MSARSGSNPPHTLYHGRAGVVIFYLELHRATGDERYLEVAVSGGNEIVHHVGELDVATVSFYSGWPGYVFALNELQGAAGIGSFLLHLATIDDLVGAKIALPDTPFDA